MMKQISLRKRNLFFKIDSYRKFIRNIKLLNSYKHKICLVCHFIYLGGYSLDILKQFLCSKVFEIYNYKDNFHFFSLTKKSENYLYNYKFQKPLSKGIVFFFSDFNDISLFVYRISLLTISPYIFVLYFLFHQ